MPFYLRKSISAGPFRFNLSKSGIGLSVGVRGFRIGTGPRGHYIHAGVKGFCYRASLGRAGQKPQACRTPIDLKPTPAQRYASDNVEMLEIESDDVLAMVDARFQDLLDEINYKCRQVRLSSLFGWASGGIAIGSMLAAATPAVFSLVPVAYLAGLWLDSYWRTTVLFYELEPEFAGIYSDLVDAFEVMAKCKKAWHVSAEGKIRDLTTWKRNAGAGYLVSRSAVSLALKLPDVIKCNLDPPSLSVGKQQLYFFPDFVLAVQGHKAGAIAYSDLRIGTRHARYIETERVPSDAQVIDHTWQHPNKKGGPDRRFAFNKRIPVCLYEEAHLTSPTGLNEVVQFSKIDVVDGFASTARTLAKFGPAKEDRPTISAIAPTGNRSSLARRNAAAIAASLVVGVGAIAAGWMSHNFATDGSPAPTMTKRSVGQATRTEPSSNWIVSTQPALNLTTGSVGKREPVPPAVGGKINVAVALSVRGGNRPVVVGHTNLPPGTQLMVTISRKESAYSAQAKVAVENGQFRAGPFSQKGNPLNPGGYLVDVTSSLAALQPTTVRTVIGERGEKLQGVATNILLGERIVAFGQIIKIDGATSPSKDAQSRANARKDHHAWWRDACRSRCNLLQGVAVKRGELFDWTPCNVKCLAEEPTKGARRN